MSHSALTWNFTYTKYSFPVIFFRIHSNCYIRLRRWNSRSMVNAWHFSTLTPSDKPLHTTLRTVPAPGAPDWCSTLIQARQQPNTTHPQILSRFRWENRIEGTAALTRMTGPYPPYLCQTRESGILGIDILCGTARCRFIVQAIPTDSEESLFVSTARCNDAALHAQILSQYIFNGQGHNYFVPEK